MYGITIHDIENITQEATIKDQHELVEPAWAVYCKRFYFWWPLSLSKKFERSMALPGALRQNKLCRKIIYWSFVYI